MFSKVNLFDTNIRKHDDKKHQFFLPRTLIEAVVQRCSVKKVFCKKGALRNFIKFTGKHLCQSLFFNKVADTFLNKTPLVAGSALRLCKSLGKVNFL